MFYGGLTRVLTQKESQKAIHSYLDNKNHKTPSSFIFHFENQNLDDFIGSIQANFNLYKDVFIRLQIENSKGIGMTRLSFSGIHNGTCCWIVEKLK